MVDVYPRTFSPRFRRFLPYASLFDYYCCQLPASPISLATDFPCQPPNNLVLAMPRHAVCWAMSRYNGRWHKNMLEENDAAVIVYEKTMFHTCSHCQEITQLKGKKIAMYVWKAKFCCEVLQCPYYKCLGVRAPQM